MSLSPDRLSIYDTLAKSVGNTPLVEIEQLLPNGNRLWVKQEFCNQLGASHYDRVFLALFKEKERLGIIHPGMNVFETTSGTAGVSFAAIGTVLGYACHVAIPAGGEKAREAAIEKAGAQLYYTPAESYIAGFPHFIKRFIKEHAGYVFFNHSMGDIDGKGRAINRLAIDTMHGIVDEISSGMGTQSVHNIISVLGNGTSALGLVERASPVTKVTAMETLASGVGYRAKYGEEAYAQLLDGFDPKNFSRHRMPGTSYPGIEFPALREAAERSARVVLVVDEKMEREWLHHTAKFLPSGVVRFHDTAPDAELATYGRSTRASIAVAQQLAKQTHNENFVVIGYDRADRYDLRPALSRSAQHG